SGPFLGRCCLCRGCLRRTSSPAAAIRLVLVVPPAPRSPGPTATGARLLSAGFGRDYCWNRFFTFRERSAPLVPRCFSQRSRGRGFRDLKSRFPAAGKGYDGLLPRFSFRHGGRLGLGGRRRRRL